MQVPYQIPVKWVYWHDWIIPFCYCFVHVCISRGVTQQNIMASFGALCVNVRIQRAMDNCITTGKALKVLETYRKGTVHKRTIIFCREMGAINSCTLLRKKLQLTFVQLFWLHHSLISEKCHINKGAAAYQLGNTSSRTITEVKQRWARLVLGWDTVQVLPECCC